HSPQWIKLSGSSPYSSFLPDVLGTASADIRCARHWRSFCFALDFLFGLRKAHRTAVSVPPQSSRANAFRKPAKNFAVPRKSTFPSLGATSLAFCAQAQQGRKKELTYEPQSAFDHRIYRQERRNQISAEWHPGHEVVRRDQKVVEEREQ